MMATQKKQRPLIRYAGSAAETSIGSKPIGSELENEFYSGRRLCQVWPPLGSGTGLSDIQLDIPETRAENLGDIPACPQKIKGFYRPFLPNVGDSNDNIEPEI
jgi:hypothetical protein